MKVFSETLQAGVPVPFRLTGRMFMLISTSAPLDISFTRGGVSLDEEADDVEAGYKASPLDGFDGFTLTSAIGQTVKLGISRGQGDYNRSVGAVDATIVRATALTNVAEATVGVAESAVLAQLATRKFAIFRALPTNTQNIALGATGVVLATAAIVLAPGDVWREPDAPGAAWYAIAGAAAQKLEILTGT